jgi:hypothetical protein
MHTVWLAKKIIELVCSGTLAQAAQDYTLELNRASRELGPKGTGRRSPSFSDRERQLRAEFLEAARREMGYAGGVGAWRAGGSWMGLPWHVAF